MAKAANQTVETKASVAGFIKKIADAKRRKDFTTMVDLMAKVTGLPPKMWGPAIVGFGSYHYVYESGREGDAPIIGLAARVNAITLYLSSKFDKREELLLKFGKYKSSKACIYVKSMEDIDMAVLAKMIKLSFDYTCKKYAIKP